MNFQPDMHRKKKKKTEMFYGVQMSLGPYILIVLCCVIGPLDLSS